MYNIETTFGAGITERDMDLIFLEEFASSEEFCRIFFNKIGIEDFEIAKVEHSVHQIGEGVNVKEAGSDTSRGESDMSIIYTSNGQRRGLLIEDKINACAQPNQRIRYDNRGRLSIANNEYEAFDVFMVAPAEYLGSPAATDYENKVSYEEILQYFEAKSDARAAFKAAMLTKAISKGHSTYIPIPSEKVMGFYDSYIDYVKKFYPSYQIITSKGADHGSKSSWIVFATFNERIKIKHKTRGAIDLLIRIEKGQRYSISDQMRELLRETKDFDASIIEFERELCLRVPVESLDRNCSVYEQMPIMDYCMKTIGNFYALLGLWQKNKVGSFHRAEN